MILNIEINCYSWDLCPNSGSEDHSLDAIHNLTIIRRLKQGPEADR